MAQINTSNSPYNNGFKEENKYSRVLFRAGRPALSQELLEEKSIIDSQIGRIGDTLFSEGAIISGMDIVPQPSNGGTTTGMPNTFSLSSLEATNTSLNTGTYTADGNIVVTSTSTLSNAYPRVDFYGTVTKGLYSTLSFTLKKLSGKLNKISVGYDTGSLTPTVYTIDGVNIATALDDNNGALIVDTTGKQVNLNDGLEHNVIVTFKTLISGSPELSLYINPGYDALEDKVSMNLEKLYVEDGKQAGDWVINPNDADASSTINRVKNYLVTSGKVYLAGAVRYFDAQTISIMGTGTETIGVSLNESIVTAADNPDLLDHTDGAVTNGMAGADRLQYNVELTYNDENATPIFVFQDNKINANGIKPDFDSISQIMAKRTYDQSGSFRTSGFNAVVKDYALDDTKLALDIDAGQAYVRGFSISTSETQRLLLDKSFDTATQTNDSFTYSTTQNDYLLSYQPVQSVQNVTASIEGSNSAVSRSTSGLQDQFSTEDVYRIVSVKQGSTVYIEGQDFVRTNTNFITWGQDASGNKLVNANIPANGSSYSVVYDYTKILQNGVDYKVTSDSQDTNNIPQTRIDIKSMGGLKPIPGSLIYVTYVYFLAREDMIMLTSDDSKPFIVHKGDPAPLNSVSPPVVNDPYSLELGYVLIYPNMDKGLFIMQTVNNISFASLSTWANRLNNLEYNITALELKDSVSKSEDPVYTKDAFSDAFNSVNMADNSNSDFTVSYDFENGQITIPAKAYASLTPEIQSDASSINTKGSLVTAPYSSDIILQQNLITGTKNVNEYEVFNVNGNLSLSPSSDNWIDTKSTTVQNDVNGGKVNISKWWWHIGQKGTTYTMDKEYTLINQMQGIKYEQTKGDAWNQTGYIISSGGTKTVDSLEEYIRENTISFTASNFLPYTDNLSITIEGIDVLSPTPDSDTYKGSATNTFKADGNGMVKGSFTIPGGIIKCGVRTVKIVNPSGAVATTTYTAQGTLKDVQSIINKTTYAVTIIDPLAQSFTLSNTRYLDYIDLYFATKASSSDTDHTSNVTIQIRELSDDGYPTKVIKAEKTLTPEQVNVSSDGSANTRVVFDNAVALTANQGYCFTILTDSNAYNMYVASKGSSITTGDKRILQSTPNSNGVLFSSSNAQTWVADPASSLKFSLSCAYYNNSGTVVFEPITLRDESYGSDVNDSVEKIDKLVALTSYLTPESTSMSWYIRILPVSATATIDTMSWSPISPANDNTALEAEKQLFENSKQVQLKAEFDSSHYVSPILTTEDLSLVGILTGTEGHYYSVNLDESDSTAQFSHVKIQYDAYLPNGTSVTPYYSVDDGNTWYTLSTNGTSPSIPTSTTQISSYYTRYVYEGTVPTAVSINNLAKQIKIKLVLKANTNFIVPTVRQLTSLMSNTLNG